MAFSYHLSGKDKNVSCTLSVVRGNDQVKAKGEDIGCRGLGKNRRQILQLSANKRQVKGIRRKEISEIRSQL